MPASVEVTRLTLRSVFANAQTNAQTLGGALLAAGLGVVPSVLSGKQLVEAQAAGIVSKFQLPAGASALPLSDVAAMWSRLLDLYDRAQVATTVVPAGGGLVPETAPIPDAAGVAIYQWMLGQLTIIRSFAMDHSCPGFRT